jgi:hypothetical protein
MVPSRAAGRWATSRRAPVPRVLSQTAAGVPRSPLTKASCPRGEGSRHSGVNGARRPRRAAAARASDCRTQRCWETYISVTSSACSCIVRGVSPCVARSWSSRWPCWGAIGTCARAGTSVSDSVVTGGASPGGADRGEDQGQRLGQEPGPLPMGQSRPVLHVRVKRIR